MKNVADSAHSFQFFYELRMKFGSAEKPIAGFMLNEITVGAGSLGRIEIRRSRLHRQSFEIPDLHRR